MLFTYNKLGKLYKLRKWSFAILLIVGIIYDFWLQFYLCYLFWSIDIKAENAGEVRILLVADPQLIGEQDETGLIGVISRWDSDRYLRSGFAYAVRASQPQAVVFMGDLLDEGTRNYDEAAWTRYAARFHNIFSWVDAKKIYLPGDNDIGGEGAEPITKELLNRFHSTFGIPRQSNPCPVGANVQLIAWPLPQPGGAFPGGILPLDMQALTSTAPKSHVLRIAISHMSLLRFLYEKDSTFQLLGQVRPDLVVSAHDHHSSHIVCDNCFTTSRSMHFLPLNEAVQLTYPDPQSHIHEVVVPTCSYRMGVPRMAYGLITVRSAPLHSNATLQAAFSLLPLPGRFPALYCYLMIGFGLILSLLFVRFCTDKTRRSGMRNVWT